MPKLNIARLVICMVLTKPLLADWPSRSLQCHDTAKLMGVAVGKYRQAVQGIGPRVFGLYCVGTVLEGCGVAIQRFTSRLDYQPPGAAGDGVGLQKPSQEH